MVTLNCKKLNEIFQVRLLLNRTAEGNTKDLIIWRDATSSNYQIISQLIGDKKLAYETNILGSNKGDLYTSMLVSLKLTLKNIKMYTLNLLEKKGLTFENLSVDKENIYYKILTYSYTTLDEYKTYLKDIPNIKDLFSQEKVLRPYAYTSTTSYEENLLQLILDMRASYNMHIIQQDIFNIFDSRSFVKKAGR